MYPRVILIIPKIQPLLVTYCGCLPQLPASLVAVAFGQEQLSSGGRCTTFTECFGPSTTTASSRGGPAVSGQLTAQLPLASSIPPLSLTPDPI